MGWLAGKRPKRLGVENGRLAPVDERRSNAVSSQALTPYHRIESLAVAPDAAAGFEQLRRVIAGTPGATIVQNRDDYIYAEYRTPTLGFVDDVEFLLDTRAAVVHVRSHSRLGRKDFGVNRRRIEAIRTSLARN